MPVVKSPTGHIFYHYIPTKVGAIIVATLFAMGTLAVLWRSSFTKTKFAIPFMVGGVLEIVGYVGRAIATENEDSLLVPFIVQSVLLLIAPALFAASIYMTLGRVIRGVGGEQRSIIRPNLLTRVFVLLDIASFLAQGAGSGFQSGKKFNKNTAEYIVLGGLVIQILGFGLFAVTALVWHVRMRRQPTHTIMGDDTEDWQSIMNMLYVVSILIMMRSVFRVIEYAGGADGYLSQHEWTLYVFDAALMLLTVGVFAWWYPGQLGAYSVIRKDESDMESIVVL
ncbi:RTA1-domain-containing protein [Polychaeton citri CBS 116435]|uniref:RTA1-domain-containing protein n=1 Tax=Polychaeton citri CBS 116435 TaxID=1314669 RepID=A0A9P4UMM2_9PEZI|nr:RTA1-domain-containing protein [Polychaeton citri CBS 116435]